jgi:hypothetical protein
MYFEKTWNLLAPSGYKLFYFKKKNLIMNMPVFNFHKKTDMHKDYSY